MMPKLSILLLIPLFVGTTALNCTVTDKDKNDVKDQVCGAGEICATKVDFLETVHVVSQSCAKAKAADTCEFAISTNGTAYSSWCYCNTDNCNGLDLKQMVAKTGEVVKAARNRSSEVSVGMVTNPLLCGIKDVSEDIYGVPCPHKDGFCATTVIRRATREDRRGCSSECKTTGECHDWTEKNGATESPATTCCCKGNNCNIESYNAVEHLKCIVTQKDGKGEAKFQACETSCVTSVDFGSEVVRSCAAAKTDDRCEFKISPNGGAYSAWCSCNTENCNSLDLAQMAVNTGAVVKAARRRSTTVSVGMVTKPQLCLHTNGFDEKKGNIDIPDVPCRQNETCYTSVLHTTGAADQHGRGCTRDCNKDDECFARKETNGDKTTGTTCCCNIENNCNDIKYELVEKLRCIAPRRTSGPEAKNQGCDTSCVSKIDFNETKHKVSHFCAKAKTADKCEFHISSNGAYSAWCYCNTNDCNNLADKDMVAKTGAVVKAARKTNSEVSVGLATSPLVCKHTESDGTEIDGLPCHNGQNCATTAFLRKGEKVQNRGCSSSCEKVDECTEKQSNGENGTDIGPIKTCCCKSANCNDQPVEVAVPGSSSALSALLALSASIAFVLTV